MMSEIYFNEESWVGWEDLIKDFLQVTSWLVSPAFRRRSLHFVIRPKAFTQELFLLVLFLFN